MGPVTTAVSLPSDGIRYPNHATQIIVAVGYLLVLPIMTVLLYNRYPVTETLRSVLSWKMSYSRVTILIALAASWCYIFVGGVLNLGVATPSMNVAVVFSSAPGFTPPRNWVSTFSSWSVHSS
ncbi:hypothetical protein VKT23_011805 [Stygiomarasmius scandens]|uniref:Uncharacterized protein n=1 Tax=Marasmiellus scandens TaxID=2682957 RepID=A0ABR1JDL9_9AGAR